MYEYLHLYFDSQKKEREFIIFFYKQQTMTKLHVARITIKIQGPKI